MNTDLSFNAVPFYPPNHFIPVAKPVAFYPPGFNNINIKYISNPFDMPYFFNIYKLNQPNFTYYKW
jgi:hypothetical protein